MKDTRVIFPALEFLAFDVFFSYSNSKSKSSGERYPNSTIPHTSFPLTRSSLQTSQTWLSIMVSLKPRPKSGSANDTSPVFMSMLMETLARNFTFSFSTMMRFMIAVQSSFLGMNFFTKRRSSSLSNSPSSSSNFLSNQSRINAGRLNAEKKFVFWRSLYTTISSKQSLNLS